MPSPGIEIKIGIKRRNAENEAPKSHGLSPFYPLRAAATLACWKHNVNRETSEPKLKRE